MGEEEEDVRLMVRTHTASKLPSPISVRAIRYAVVEMAWHCVQLPARFDVK